MPRALSSSIFRPSVRRRWLGWALPLLLVCAGGCDGVISEIVPPDASIDRTGQTGPQSDREPRVFGEGRASIRDEISVATWNIQVLGKSKISKPDVMGVIVDTIRRFDVIAVQELRSKDQSVIQKMLRMINGRDYAYDVVVGPRLGRTSSQEQYLYFYDTRRIELIDGSVYTINDRHDLLHREPLVASFRVVSANASRPWTFTLVNIHTDPDEVKEEIDVLDDVIRFVRKTDAEDDVILLGDLNADARHLGELARIPNLMWTVTGAPTNTRRTRSYDNILFSGTSTREFTGASGIIDLEGEYALTREQALAVSDHLPVWAAFAPVERPARVAAVPSN